MISFDTYQTLLLLIWAEEKVKGVSVIFKVLMCSLIQPFTSKDLFKREADLM